MSDVNESNYRTRVLLGVTATAFARFTQIFCIMASTVIVGRILSPEDYGVFAMASPIIGFAFLFQNAGFDQAIIQHQLRDDETISSLFWINIILCSVTAIMLIAVSPLVSAFYGNYAAGHIVAASSLLILATAPNPIYNAILSRDLRFRAQNFVDVVGNIISLMIVVVASFAIKSYWALWLGAVLGTFANTVLFLAVEKWRPSFVIKLSKVAPHLRFGAGISFYSFAIFFSRNIDNVLIAKVWGTDSLGLYDRAYKLMLFPLQNLSGPMSRNLLPVLARIQDQPARYRRAYLLFATGAIFGISPGIIALSAGSEEAVLILLGKKWVSAAPIFTWLAASAAFMIVNEFAVYLFYFSQNTTRLVRWGLFTTLTSILSFLIGLPWGGYGIAIAIFFAELTRSPFLFFFACRNTSIKPIDFLKIHLITLLSAISYVLPKYLVDSDMQVIGKLSIYIAISYAGGVVALLLTGTGRDLISLSVGFIINSYKNFEYRCLRLSRSKLKKF